MSVDLDSKTRLTCYQSGAIPSCKQGFALFTVWFLSMWGGKGSGD